MTHTIAEDTNGTIKVIDNHVKLILHTGKVLNLGVLHTAGGVVSYYKNESESDRFRINDSWSINNEVLMHIDGTINYRTDTAVYRITKGNAIMYGDYLHFKTSGVEKKLYVPVMHWSTEVQDELILQGKYKGKHPESIEDLQYLKWMVSQKRAGYFFGRKAVKIAQDRIKSIEYYSA